MRLAGVAVGILTAVLMVGAISWAQPDGQVSSLASGISVPRVIRIAGVVRDESGKAQTGSAGITFTLYRDQSDQDAVWQETQDVRLDAAGHYSVLLGATSGMGLPVEIFTSGEARWLGVRADGQAEQPRILFVSVAYALKAADSDLLGGRPASAFVLAGSQNPSAPVVVGRQISGSPTGLPLLVSPQAACSAITSDGTATANKVTKFTTACNIEASAIFESGGSVGIGTTTPGAVLDVAGTGVIEGLLTAKAGIVVAPTGTATASAGFVSAPLDIEASLYNTTLGRAANYIYQWQAEPVGNNSATTSATLNLLYGVPGSVSETGISVNNKGIMTFASGQTFPGTGTGTVTSVGTGAGLTGGPITGSGTISIPSAGVTNAMLASNSVTVTAGPGLSGGGSVALGGSVQLAANLSGTTNGMAYFSSPAAVASTSAPSNGQILIGATGKAPVLSTLTAGSNVTITNNAGAITISAASGGGGGALPFFATAGGRTGSKQAATANVAKLWGFLLPYSVTTTQLTYDVATADKTANDYDVGIYDNSGNLVVNLGPTPGSAFSGSAGFKTLPWLQGSSTLAPGRYYLGFTTSCASACAQIEGSTANISFLINTSGGASTGGALPSSVTPPADKWATGIQPSVVIQ